ncbi:hypothetical protein CCS79_14620 [Clostridium diolis]|uniref:glycosyltransferase family 8 protein n=1 Tax=Clostridium diolis TaxID=223919 RepID=UPI000B3FFAC6|nr:glycosyltransferase family 8 protein [Clostridium diolis]OVE67351.1 hypothetical protein CCS79_14620 [Clostridium diolis]
MEFALKPAFKNDNVTIVLMSSNYYVPYLSTVIRSIINNSKSENNYDIIILHREISAVYQNIILGLCGENINIRFYNPEDLLKEAKLYVASDNYAREAYYRLLVPWILKEYNKAIVLDCDIIVNTDIAILFNLNIKDCFVAGVKDIIFEGMLKAEYGTYKYSKEILNLEKPENYINTGVIILNLKNIRESYTIVDVISLAQSHKYRFQEQDVINALFCNRIYYLDITWNCYVELNEEITMCIEAASDKSKNNYYGVVNDPQIYHFASSPKPWENPEIDYSEIFWDVAKQSPFYERILARMVKYMTNYKYNQTPISRILPIGTKGRYLLDKILIKGSKRRKIIKKIVNLFLKNNRK